ncbi:hypothetical protein DPMN_070000 [Dreissena polymorpha]|uniref:Uncharacterized protein n=1 Tax=Dreissena polymorpha TaxID=45954 RepID=A0A9D3Z4A9_DREPO|nr:hypothetical protein DPMN_070000 [Dreissena polymorpha]
MVCGPVVARVVNEFEATVANIMHSQSKGPDLRHHEQVKGVQSTFRQQVPNLVATMQDMGNPFEEQSNDLLTLDTRDIADDAVIATVRAIEQVGTEQYNTFVAERIDTQQKPLTDPKKHNKFPLFSRQSPQGVSKQKKRNYVFKTKLFVI